MTTVKDFMDNNDNTVIRLYPEGGEKFQYPIYEGMLYDIPEEIQKLEVTGAGRLSFAGCQYLFVRREREYVIEINETLQKVVSVTAASEKEAIKRVSERYYNGQIILEAEDLKDIKIKNYAGNTHRIRDSDERKH